MGEHYDGTKLLSMKDATGRTPELYLVTTNRTGGKTTYFNRLLVNRFFKRHQKFMLLYRYSYEISDVPNKFFDDIRKLFFQNHEMTERKICRGVFSKLYIDHNHCGFAVPLNSADMVKKYSHFFSCVDAIVFDEFMSETNNYCSDEVSKFISIHTSVARGGGKHVRYVPVYMLGNATTILNPYYTALGISGKLTKDTRFMRGDGFVLESGMIQAAADAQKESGFNRAFKSQQYVQYSAENVYLMDNYAFIKKPSGYSRYLCTIKVDGKEYGIREYSDDGFIYASKSVDNSFKLRITTDTNDHEVNYIMLKNNASMISGLRYFFNKGLFRFRDLESKNAVLKLLSY